MMDFCLLEESKSTVSTCFYSFNVLPCNKSSSLLVAPLGNHQWPSKPVPGKERHHQEEGNGMGVGCM